MMNNNIKPLKALICIIDGAIINYADYFSRWTPAKLILVNIETFHK